MNLLASHSSLPAPELSALLLDEFTRWLPPSTSQQDDVTLIVIDVA